MASRDNQMKRDKDGKPYIEPVAPEFIGPDGRIIPFAQRDSLRRQVAERAQAEADYQRREIQAAKTPAQKRVELFARQAAEARARGDIKLAEMYENQLPAVRAERQEE